MFKNLIILVGIFVLLTGCRTFTAKSLSPNEYPLHKVKYTAAYDSTCPGSVHKVTIKKGQVFPAYSLQGVKLASLKFSFSGRWHDNTLAKHIVGLKILSADTRDFYALINPDGGFAVPDGTHIYTTDNSNGLFEVDSFKCQLKNGQLLFKKVTK